jgi:hypothetical protein
MYWMCTRKLTEKDKLAVALRMIAAQLQKDHLIKTSEVYDYPGYRLEVTLTVKQNNQ